MAEIAPLAAGHEVGSYRLQFELGSGGMGTVWLAGHVQTGARVAVKILHAEYNDRDDIVQRFFNEARAAGAVTDKGIVEIFEFGHTHDGRAFIVMEFLEGESLDQRLRRVGKLPLPVALRVVRQVAGSVGAAHARGIVHRDLKPENVFLAKDPEAPGGERTKVLDFGIAKLEWGSNVKTRTQAVMGTPMYMSPEQCRGASDVDHRSDVYAMGCLLFAVLTGYPPFYADGPGQVFLMHLQMPVPSLASRAVDAPPEIEALIRRCLEKQPANRFATGTELAAAIDTLQPAPIPAPEAVATAAAKIELPPAPPVRGSWLGVALLALVVVTIAIAIALRV